jgi:hypothetical protein
LPTGLLQIPRLLVREWSFARSRLDMVPGRAKIRGATCFTLGGTMSTDYMLAYGTHATPDDGRCAMEWVS